MEDEFREFNKRMKRTHEERSEQGGEGKKELQRMGFSGGGCDGFVGHVFPGGPWGPGLIWGRREEEKICCCRGGGGGWGKNRA